MTIKLSHISQDKTLIGPDEARHCHANLAPFPDPLEIAPRYLNDYDSEQIQRGLRTLHRLFASIYRAGVDSPELLASCDQRKQRTSLTGSEFMTYPRLLFAFGIFGSLAKNSDHFVLRVDWDDLTRFCAQARAKNCDACLMGFENFGLVCLPTQPLQVAYPAEPELIPALHLFANACLSLTKKDINPPAEFLRADMRRLEISRKKVRQVPLEPKEAIHALRDPMEAAFIQHLSDWATSAGYRVETRCAAVQKSEFRVKYSLPKPSRVLFGFRTDEGRLHMHVVFNQMKRILPYIALTPRSFRELYYERCKCAECGWCKTGPEPVELDGAVRRLCWFSYMNLPEVPPEHYETLMFLLRNQDSILREV